MNLVPLIDQLSNARILVIGDLMLDHYIWGDIHRISPEAPVPVVHATRDTYTAGGAANVALNLAKLGVQTSILGYYQQDEAGRKLNDILGQNKIRVIPFSFATEAPTIIKTRVVVRNQQLCRIDREFAPSLYRIDTVQDFETTLKRELEQADAVIISDYAKGVISQSLVDQVLNIAKQSPGLFISVDPKPSNKLSFTGIDLLKPNKGEALELAGITLQHPDEDFPLEDVCKKIYEIYQPVYLIITLGAQGMAICERGKVIKVLPTVAREVFDVSGAGDTVVAVLTAALASGANAEDAAMLANAAAGSVIARMGTIPITSEDLKRWIR